MMVPNLMLALMLQSSSVGMWPYKQVVEEGKAFQVNIWRQGDLSKPVMVRYQVGGSAEGGVDYKPRIGPQWVVSEGVFPAGTDHITITEETIKTLIVTKGSPNGKPNLKWFVFQVLPSIKGEYKLGYVKDAIVGIGSKEWRDKQCAGGWAVCQ